MAGQAFAATGVAEPEIQQDGIESILIKPMANLSRLLQNYIDTIADMYGRELEQGDSDMNGPISGTNHSSNVAEARAEKKRRKRSRSHLPQEVQMFLARVDVVVEDLDTMAAQVGEMEMMIAGLIEDDDVADHIADAWQNLQIVNGKFDTYIKMAKEGDFTEGKLAFLETKLKRREADIERISHDIGLDDLHAQEAALENGLHHDADE